MGFSRWLQPNLKAIQTRILSDPYCRLQSAEEIAIAAALGIGIDVNQASVDDWLRLPGLSIHQARSLVELTQNGVSFYCIEDIAAALNLPMQRLLPLKPVLRFCFYEVEEGQLPGRINPNTATIQQLTQIPFVDLTLAKAIAHNRQVMGNYRNLAQFQQRLSLPGQLTAQLMHYLQF